MLHHGFTDPAALRSWLATWAERLANPKLAALRLRRDLHVISESLHRHNYKVLWDLVFDRRPHGPEVPGMWTGRHIA
jgi:hypothetical protein